MTMRTRKRKIKRTQYLLIIMLALFISGSSLAILPAEVNAFQRSEFADFLLGPEIRYQPEEGNLKASLALLNFTQGDFVAIDGLDVLHPGMKFNYGLGPNSQLSSEADYDGEGSFFLQIKNAFYENRFLELAALGQLDYNSQQSSFDSGLTANYEWSEEMDLRGTALVSIREGEVVLDLEGGGYYDLAPDHQLAYRLALDFSEVDIKRDEVEFALALSSQVNREVKYQGELALDLAWENVALSNQLEFKPRDQEDLRLGTLLTLETAGNHELALFGGYQLLDNWEFIGQVKHQRGINSTEVRTGVNYSF